MDVNTFRIVVMLGGLVLFLALMAHTFSRKRRQVYEEAAMLPFRSDDTPGTPAAAEGTGNAGERP